MLSIQKAPCDQPRGLHILPGPRAESECAQHSRVAPTGDTEPPSRAIWGPSHQNVGVLQNALFLLGWDCLLMSLICGPLA